jgi:hypothetical protein
MGDLRPSDRFQLEFQVEKPRSDLFSMTKKKKLSFHEDIPVRSENRETLSEADIPALGKLDISSGNSTENSANNSPEVSKKRGKISTTELKGIIRRNSTSVPEETSPKPKKFSVPILPGVFAEISGVTEISVKNETRQLIQRSGGSITGRMTPDIFKKIR